MSRLDWERDGRDWPNRAASRFVRAGGLDWHVQTMGQGPTVWLIHGTGAATHSWRDILPLLAQRPRLMGMVDALVRVDERRWDLRLKDGSLIQLPATEQEAALIRLDALDQRERLLDLGFARVDLRTPDEVAVRPAGDA